MGFEKDRRGPFRKFADWRGVRQRTLKSSIHCSGVALHSGAKVALTLHPADPNTGIVFKRVDIAGGGALIPARWDHVVDTRLCTMLGNKDGVTIGTVEHLLAALAGSAVDNVLIELNGPEVPIMDGSSEPFLFLVECAGIVEQDAPRRAIRIEKPVSVIQGDKSAWLLPSDGFSVAFEITFKSAAIGTQTASVGMGHGIFKNEIARARTFCMAEEVQQLWSMGLARGGSLDNAIVVSGDRVLNEGGLRFDDEFVRHKVLDAVGDLTLAGAPIIGHYHGRCSGHALTNQLLRTLFADETAWSSDIMSTAEMGGPSVVPDVEAARDKVVMAVGA